MKANLVFCDGTRRQKEIPVACFVLSSIDRPDRSLTFSHLLIIYWIIYVTIKQINKQIN